MAHCSIYHTLPASSMHQIPALGFHILSCLNIHFQQEISLAVCMEVHYLCLVEDGCAPLLLCSLLPGIESEILLHNLPILFLVTQIVCDSRQCFLIGNLLLQQGA